MSAATKVIGNATSAPQRSVLGPRPIAAASRSPLELDRSISGEPPAAGPLQVMKLFCVSITAKKASLLAQHTLEDSPPIDCVFPYQLETNNLPQGAFSGDKFANAT